MPSRNLDISDVSLWSPTTTQSAMSTQRITLAPPASTTRYPTALNDPHVRFVAMFCFVIKKTAFFLPDTLMRPTEADDISKYGGLKTGSGNVTFVNFILSVVLVRI